MRIWRSVVVGALLFLSLNQVNAQNNTDINNTINNNITNFAQLVQAVEGGEDVRAIIHFDNCQLTGPALPTQITRRLTGASTRFNFTNFFHGQETVNNELIDTVTTSMKLFIQNSSGEFLTLSGRLSVFEDNTATLHVNFFDPILHKQHLVVDWQCNISNGEDNNGLVLFNFS
ncbi:Uncharacterised protein [Legionella steigerwaltii]|uniref:VirK protein n=1 Tax=Legionella steigerwaltii TaxID=460 RepID=A0A378L3R9_9GAMM|nr:hypothetical protein [Legionella steigerwaltii]KTD69952.1 hypothetical protein Lstg_3393 [Legionella steigerwaltii]STY21735.1 Uncharacterised protein [Legionella steigerwaltii]